MFLQKQGWTSNTKALLVLASLSPSLFGTAPTAPPHTAGTSVHSQKTHDLVYFPRLQSPISISSQALKWRYDNYNKKNQQLVVREIIILWPLCVTLGRCFCSSDLCFSSLRRFPPLFVNLVGSVAFFCKWNRWRCTFKELNDAFSTRL